MSSRWVRVCAVEDVPPLEGRRIELDGYELAVFHTEDGFYALHDVCPHRAGPLSDGDVAGGVVSCPLHARKVDLKTGEVKNDNLSRVPTFPLKTESSGVYVDSRTLSSLLEERRAV